MSRWRRVLFVPVAVVMIAASFLVGVTSKSAKALDGWMDTNWQYRRQITIGGAHDDYFNERLQINLSKLYNHYDFEAMQNDADDIRFTASDGTTQLSFWKESFNQSANTGIFWVKVPFVDSSLGATIYMYYGNNAATSASNGDNTFPFFDDFSGTAWTSKTNMPYNAADFTATEAGGKFYLFGGFNNGSGDVLNTVYEYNPSTDSYTSKASMANARWGAISANVGGMIYVMGGQGAANNINAMYNPSNNTWTPKANLPAAISAQGITGCSDGTYIYLYYNKYLYRYDPVNNNYTQLTSSTRNVLSWASCSSYNGNLYFIGGYASGTGSVAYTQIYNISGNSWSDGANSPFAEYGAVRENPVIDGKIYLIQGERADGEFSSKAYVYDITGNSWAEKSYGPHAVVGAAGGAYNGKIYTFGGMQDTSTMYGTNFATAYDPSQDTGTAKWHDIGANFEVSGGKLRQMAPARGTRMYRVAQIRTNTYQTGADFRFNIGMNQPTSGSYWSSLAVHSNGGTYNGTNTGYLIPYNDFGSNPDSTSLYKENGTTFTNLTYTTMTTGDIRYQYTSDQTQMNMFDITNNVTWPSFDTTYRGGYLGVVAATGNTATWDYMFARPYGQDDLSVYFEHKEDQSGPVSETFSAWTTGDTAASSAVGNMTTYTLATRFYSDVDGLVTGIRYYKASGMQDAHIFKLWSSNGTLLASKLSVEASGSGWREVTLDTPVSINANTQYLVGYVALASEPYAYTSGQFASQGRDRPPIHLYKDGTFNHNGMFCTGSSCFPTSTYGSTNYWTDVVFAPSV